MYFYAGLSSEHANHVIILNILKCVLLIDKPAPSLEMWSLGDE